MHVVEYVNSSFLFIAEQYSTVSMYHGLLNQPLVEGHLGCSQFLAVINKDALIV